MKDLYCGFCNNKLKIASKLFQSYICLCYKRKYYIAFLTRNTIQGFTLIFDDGLYISSSKFHPDGDCFIDIVDLEYNNTITISMNWKNFIENNMLNVNLIRDYINRYLKLQVFI